MKDSRITLEEWEEFLGYKIVKEHSCTKVPNDADIAIFYCIFDDVVQEDWLLAKAWIAQEEEVADGEADSVGQLLSCSSFKIGFCPFCGEKLTTERR